MSSFFEGETERKIRVGGYDDTDSEADEGSSESGSERELPQQNDYVTYDSSAKLSQNKLYIQQLVDGQTWKLSYAIADSDIRRIIKPTASNINHLALNPFLYRSVKPMTLDDLARIVEAPLDWQTKSTDIWEKNASVKRSVNLLRAKPPGTYEAQIEFLVGQIVCLIAYALDIVTFPSSQTNVYVGGFLAEPSYDMKSQTDCYFKKSSGLACFLATEVKRLETYKSTDIWYENSRGAQVFSQMFGRNCPTFLMNQLHFKVFAEDDNRSRFYTYPFNPPSADDLESAIRVNSSQCANIGIDFVHAIVICLLAAAGKKDASDSDVDGISSGLAKSSLNEPTTPHRPSAKKMPSSTNKPVASVSSGVPTTRSKSSSFVAGFDASGAEIIQHIRTYTASEMAIFEEEDRLSLLEISTEIAAARE